MATSDTAAEYRPVSRLAVAALVVGACSALAVFSVVAWVLPLVGVAVAVAALRDLDRPGVLKAGRLAAVAGLALAVGFGGQAVTATLVTRAIVARRAEATAAFWIDAVRDGRTADALAITAIHFSESAPGTDAERLAVFSGLSPVQAVAACGGTRPAPERIEPLGNAENDWTIRVPLAPCGGVRAKETLVLTVAPRTLPTPGGAIDRWSVTEFTLIADR